MAQAFAIDEAWWSWLYRPLGTPEPARDTSASRGSIALVACTGPQAYGLEFERTDLLGLGVPSPVVDTIQGARAPSIIREYSSRWRLFSSWCSERGLDPVSCPVQGVLEFLQDQDQAFFPPHILQSWMLGAIFCVQSGPARYIERTAGFHRTDQLFVVFGARSRGTPLSSQRLLTGSVRQCAWHMRHRASFPLQGCGPIQREVWQPPWRFCEAFRWRTFVWLHLGHRLLLLSNCIFGRCDQVGRSLGLERRSRLSAMFPFLLFRRK
ncbi:hypothetical protein WMY93_002007 [Mugilogobius chulae]|uniref:Uncharacterized protein n=1 Tax=Mugilogobius chulae TaxID=88201 RepID=A0AAW0PSF7_9GOBI